MSRLFMPAITLTQPWATLVAIGAKRVETRSWPTGHRSRLAIHAAKGWASEDRELCEAWPFRECLAQAGISAPHELPLGAIVAICRVARVARTEDAVASIERIERRFGNYDPGRFAWFLEDIQQLEPIPCRGSLGLWAPPVDVLVQIQAQLCSSVCTAAVAG